MNSPWIWNDKLEDGYGWMVEFSRILGVANSGYLVISWNIDFSEPVFETAITIDNTDKLYHTFSRSYSIRTPERSPRF